MQSALPVSANGKTVSVHRLRSYVDDFYNRIHIRPTSLALGNVVSAQISTVRVFNAFFKQQVLSEINGQDAGLSVLSDNPLPMTVPALKETEWRVSVTPDGPSVLDQYLSWIFTDGSTTLHVTGNRIIAWTFSPDWAEGVTERLAWLTDILQSKTAVEQRRALRLAPRRTFEANMVVEGRERSYMDMLLFGWSARIFALPIWHDQQWLQEEVVLGTQSISCDTTDRDFRIGGLALLLGGTAFDFEAVEIAGMTPTSLQLSRPTQRKWGIGARLFPMRSARLTEVPQPTRQTDRLSRLSVSFLVVEGCDWPAIMPATMYRGRPVLETRPEESEELTEAYQRLVLLLDNSTGIPVATDTADAAFRIQGFRWVLHGRQEQSLLRSLLYALCGRQKEIWLPTHTDDLQLMEIAVASSMQLDVSFIGYTRFANGQQGRRDIRIELIDGTVLFRRITSATELSDQVERLFIDAVLGRIIEPGEVGRICFMALARLDQDELELHHDTDSDGIASLQTVFRGIPDLP